MPLGYVKRRAVRGGRVRKIYRRVGARPLGRARRMGMYNPSPVFTETADFGSFAVQPSTGLFTSQLSCQLNSIPQIANYTALYNQARILKVTYLLMPNYNMFTQGTDVALATLPVSAPRIVYSIQDTSAAPPPVAEIDVLTDNGCKIRQFTKPLKITCRPTPALSEGISTGGFAAVNVKGRFLTLNTNGLTVPHVGVNYAVTQDAWATANPPLQWQVYAKITFQLRDPK